MFLFPDKTFEILKCLLFRALILFALTLITQQASAEVDWECYLNSGCRNGSGRSSANPSTGGQIRINPAAVPTESGFGVEGIYYNQEVDFSLVRGLGRVGAAISPSNSEETFFGPPGYETTIDYFQRHYYSKYHRLFLPQTNDICGFTLFV